MRAAGRGALVVRAASRGALVVRAALVVWAALVVRAARTLVAIMSNPRCTGGDVTEDAMNVC